MSLLLAAEEKIIENNRVLLKMSRSINRRPSTRNERGEARFGRVGEQPDRRRTWKRLERKSLTLEGDVSRMCVLNPTENNYEEVFCKLIENAGWLLDKLKI